MPIYSDVTYIGPANVTSATGSKYGITFHNTSNSRLASATDEATYAKRRTDASAHYYVDKTRIVQSLNTDLGAGHAGSSWPNRHCIAYEITGWNSFSRDRWLSDVAWGLLVRQVRRDCERWNIPMRWLTVDQLRRGERGFSTHDDCRRAFGGTSHTDPGPNFPKDHLIALLKGETEEDDMALSDRIDYTPWYKTTYGDASGTVEETLAELMAYSRNASDKTAAVKTEQAEQRKLLEATLAKVSGADTKSILDAVKAAAAAEVARDAQLRTLVEQAVSGQLSAEAVVERMAVLLSGTDA